MRHVYADRATYLLTALLIIGAAVFGWFRSEGIILLSRAELSTQRPQEVVTEDGLPAGGRDLLHATLESCTSCDALATLATMDYAQEDWESYLEQHNALVHLTAAQIATLTSYLALHFPLSEEDATALEEADTQALPPDGHELLTRACTGCHALATAVRLDTDVRVWRRLLNDPDHSGLLPSNKQVEELANYLALNSISLEEVR